MRIGKPGRIAIRMWPFLLSLSSLSRAASPQAVVVLVSTDAKSTTARRLEAELQSMDVTVLRVTASSEGTSIRKELQRVARERGAFAAVRIVSDGDEAEVWVADRVTGKTLVREVVSRKDAGAFDDAVSLGAVELLRASLLEVSTAAETQGEVAPSVVAPRLLPKLPTPNPNVKSVHSEGPTTAQLWVAFEPTVDLGIGALSTGSGFDVDLKLLSSQGWGGELLTHLSGAGQTVERPVGRATLRSQQVGLMGCYAPTSGRLSASVSIGMAAAYVTSSGSTVLPNVAREQRRFSLSSLARLGVAFRLLPSLGFRVDATAGYAIPPLEVRMVGRKVAGYDHPYLFVGAGVEFRLPLETGN